MAPTSTPIEHARTGEHELVFHANYPAMQFLIDHGIDMTTRDHRWNASAEGWASHAAKDEAMAKFLGDAAQRAR